MSKNEGSDSTGKSGLSQSTPLVNVAGTTSVARNLVAVPAGNDHPLAAVSSPPPAQSPASLPPTTPSQPAMMSTPGTVGTPHGTPLQGTSSGTVAAVSPTIQTLDDMADAFLSAPSYRTQQLGLTPLLKPMPLPRQEGVARLRTLVERRAWGDVLKIATGMLNSPKGLHGDVYASLVMLPLNAPKIDISTVSMEVRLETVEIMTLQCHAWLKLRRYADLAAEVERWNFVTHNDATAQSPDWLPWSLHILAGLVQQFTEESDGASDILFSIRERIPKEDVIWLTSIDNALANMFVRQSEWRLGLGSLDRILEQIPQATKQYVEKYYSSSTNTTELEEILASTFKCEVLSRQGRILLQVGALPEVAEVFEMASQLWASVEPRIPSELSSHNLVKTLPVQMLANEGLFDFAKSRYDRAMTSFSRGMELIRSRRVPTQNYDPEDWLGPSVVCSEALTVVYAECANNMSLCALYTCRMKDAVDFLEGSIREDPGCFLTERSAFNLCTLYELGADSATSAKQKRVLQLIAKRFFLHDVGPESFRVN